MVRKLPSDRPSLKDLSEKLRRQILPSPPKDWIEWLTKTKQVMASTIRLYSHHISQLLGFSEIIFPSHPPSILLVWNLDFCQLFLEVIRNTVSPSTFQNYYSSLTAVRRFLSKTKRRPENFADINDDFTDMRVAGQRKKSKYVRKQKELLKNENTPLLRRFYQEVYHHHHFWKLFNAMVERSRRAITKKRVPKFSRGHLFFANGFIISIFQSCNFKRVGNYGEIKCAESRVELEKALDKFEAKFPEYKIPEGPHRLNRKYSVPAVLKAENGKKKDDLEWFVLLNPRDILAVQLYIDFIRPYGQHPPKTDALLVNSQGESLGYNVTR